jgi:ribosomal protein S18 acetylase RimI-like enzyme
MQFIRHRSVSIVPMTRGYLPKVLRDVGGTVDALYPLGLRLFEARLKEAVEGRAHCTLAIRHGRLVGLAAQTSKGDRRAKISTLWVHPLYRRHGVGSALVSHVCDGWLRSELDRVHITVSSEGYAGVFGLLANFGFEHLTVERDRYGEGRDEAVLVWTPDQVARSASGVIEPVGVAGCRVAAA